MIVFLIVMIPLISLVVVGYFVQVAPEYQELNDGSMVPVE
jgi:hypothetical protein